MDGSAPESRLPSTPPPQLTEEKIKADASCGDYSAVYDSRFAATQTVAEVLQTLTADLHVYGLEFRAETTLDLPAMRKFGAMLVSAYKRNSVAWITRAGLKKIVLATPILVAGQPRSAKPDVGAHAVWYDPAMLGDCRASREEVIHHEFYHLAEATIFGNYFYRDAAWAALNPADFRYGPGGSAAYNNPAYHATDHPLPGFASEYSTYGLEEDKAEIYAWLRTPGYAERLVEWSRTDAVLARKVAHLRAHLGEVAAP